MLRHKPDQPLLVDGESGQTGARWRIRSNCSVEAAATVTNTPFYHLSKGATHIKNERRKEEVGLSFGVRLGAGLNRVRGCCLYMQW